VHNLVMAKHVIHISEKEAAATNVATLLAHVRAGLYLIKVTLWNLRATVSNTVVARLTVRSP
jgi:hypothetical protein